MNPLNKETIDQILELSGGDDSLIIELFESFLTDADELVGNIKDACASKDLEKLKFDVHTLKGLCGTIGANDLFEVSKTLNDDLKGGVTDSVESSVEELIIKHKELIQHITSNCNVQYEA